MPYNRPRDLERFRVKGMLWLPLHQLSVESKMLYCQFVDVPFL